MEEKKNTGLLVVVAILCLIVGLAGGYFISTKLLNKNESNTTNENKEINDEKMTVYSVSDPKVSKLIDNLVYSNDGASCEGANIWNFANDRKIETKDISSETAFDMVVEYKDLNNDGKITSEEIEKQIQIILGKAFKFDSNINVDRCTGPAYSSKTKELYYITGNCGGTCGSYYYTTPSYKIVKAIDTNGMLEMSIKVVFENDNNKIYSDYAKKNIIATYNDKDKKFIDSKNEVLTLDEVLSRGSDYKFTFKLEDGNYVYVSSEPLK